MMKTTVADNPKLIAEWDYEKNDDLSPDQVGQYSKKRAWWICEKGHSWQAVIKQRHDTGCPICSGHIVARGINDLQTLYPEIAAQWDYEHNRGTGPEDIQAGSNTPYWWKCTQGHKWKVSPNHRIRGTGCPYCTNKKVLAGFNDLETRNPELLKEWDYEKNDDVLKPCDCNYLSNRKVWWICAEGHSWKTAVSDRTRAGRGCPFCAGQRTIAGENDLLTLNPTLAEEWDHERNGDLRPEHVMAGSGKKVWWKCSNGHSWRAAVYSRKNNGCPICSGRLAVSGVNDLKTIMPEVAAQWDYKKNGDLLPEKVAAQSNRIIWWRCEKGHSWKAKPCERFAGNGCPRCNGRIKMVTHFMS